MVRLVNTLDPFRIAWGSSLAELVGPEPANLEGELAPLVDGLEVSAARAEVSRIVAALAHWLWSRNQFLLLSAAERAELAQSVELALRTMKRRDQARAALRKHRKELAGFVRRKLGDEPLEVTCAEYSPALQLQVLGLSEPLAAPLLDIGCGPSAALVRHLRSQGLDARGLDRALDPALGISADWLEHDYGQADYRSVLSHQGFSLHFLHHHHAQGDTALAYARTYMAILRALTPGGVFAYAPGLPFIEPMLEASVYSVRRVPFADALRVPALVEVEQRTGLSFSYATHVQRR
jgi:SAM-dependent methyltransferase